MAHAGAVDYELMSPKDLAAQVMELKFRVEMMRTTQKLEHKDLGDQMEKLRASTRERVSGQEQRLEMLQETWMRSAADLQVGMDAMRESLMQEVVGMGHGGILQFMEAHQDTTRQKLIHMEEKLNDGLKAARRDADDVSKQLSKVQEEFRRELSELGQRPLLKFAEQAQESRKQEAEEIAKRLDTCELSAADADLVAKLRAWIAAEVAELQLASRGLRVWASDEITRLNVANESLKEQISTVSKETRRQVEESQDMVSALKIGMLSALNKGGTSGVDERGQGQRTDSTGGSGSTADLGGSPVAGKG